MRACVIASILAIAAGVMAAEPAQPPRYFAPAGAFGGMPGMGMPIDPEQRIVQLRELLTQFDKRTAEIEKQLPAAQKKAQSLPLPLEAQQELQDKTISHPAMRKMIDGIIARHAAAVQAQELELVGLRARREAIQRAMAEQSERLKALVKEDAIAAQLQQVVAAKEQQLAQLKRMHEQGTTSFTEVSQATAGLAESRARLLERQEVVADRNGGDVLAAWNRELMNLSVDTAEKQAKQQVMEARLAAVRDAWKAHLELTDLQNEQERIRRERIMAASELGEMERQRNQPAAK